MVLGPDNCFYMFGGTDGNHFFGDLYRYHIQTNDWIILDLENAPSTRFAVTRPTFYSHYRYRHEVVVDRARGAVSMQSTT